VDSKESTTASHCVGAAPIIPPVPTASILERFAMDFADVFSLGVGVQKRVRNCEVTGATPYRRLEAEDNTLQG